MLKYLRAAPAVDIVKGNEYGRNVGVVFTPVYGSKLLPLNPVQALKNGNFYHVDLLFSSNQNEGSLFAEVIFPNYLSPKIKDPIVKRKEAKVMIELLFAMFQEKNPSEVSEYYLKNITDDDFNGLRNAVNSAFGDYHLTCPTFFFGETFAKISKSNNVYGYLLSDKPALSAVLECTGYFSWYVMLMI